MTTQPRADPGTQVQVGAVGATAQVWEDPRERITIGVLRANGRLAGRAFATRAEAEAWAEDGERVVELNEVCDCDM